MSNIIKKESKSLVPSFKLGIRDTDFLLRLIKRSTIPGTEIEQAHEVIRKLNELHRINLEG